MTHVRRTLLVALTAVGVLTASGLAYGDGVDVSHYQGTINWTKVDNAGVTFAFMKATEGTTYTDSMFAGNWAAAASVGIYRGAYHFARPSSSSGAAQAKYYVSKVGAASFKQPGVLPPVLDLEVTGGLGVTKLKAWVSDWLTTAQGLTGRTPILYFSPYFWIDNMGNSTAYTRYPMWIAHYTSAGAPMVPGGWARWTFWQYTSSGSVAGIAGNVDKNRFNGNSAALAALAGATGGSTAPVPPGPSTPTADPTSLSLTPATSSTAAINDPVGFSGTLTSTTAGSLTPTTTAVIGSPVGLYTRPVGSTVWSQLATTTTSSTGTYDLSAAVPRSADYQTRFAGDATHSASTSPVTRVTTPARTQLALDLHANHLRVRRGAPVMLYGHVTNVDGGVAGTYVRVYKKPVSGGRWRFVSRTGSLAPTGWWSLTVHPLRARVYKAVTYDTTYFLGTTTRTLTVRVR